MKRNFMEKKKGKACKMSFVVKIFQHHELCEKEDEIANVKPVGISRASEQLYPIEYVCDYL